MDLSKLGKKKSKRLKLIERWVEKRAAITSSNDEESFYHEYSFEGINVEDNESLRLGKKRKVCFISPKNKTIFINPNHALARQTDNADSSRKNKYNGDNDQKKKIGLKKKYIPKPTILSLIIKPAQMVFQEDKNKGGELSIDLGQLSLTNPKVNHQDEDLTDSSLYIVKET